MRDCNVQIAIDGATRRAGEKKTIIFTGRAGEVMGRERKRVCSNYSGLLNLVCEGGR